MTAATSMSSVWGHQTLPASVKQITAMLFIALPSSTRVALMDLSSATPNRLHIASIIRPTAPPK